MAKSHAQGSAFRATLRVFKLFGHPMRVIIFQRLARSPMTSGELSKSLPIKRSAVVQHIKLMEGARLVEAFADGRRRVYHIKPKGLVPLTQWLKQQVDVR